MIMMLYRRPWPSLQLTGQAGFWHPTSPEAAKGGGEVPREGKIGSGRRGDSATASCRLANGPGGGC
jgi:hypothetical protein